MNRGHWLNANCLKKEKNILYPRLMKKEEESRKMSTTASEKQTLKDNFGAK